MNAPVDVLRVMDRSAHQHWMHNDNADAEDAETALTAVALLIEWAEHALECISASKYPNTHAELAAALTRVKGGAA